MRCNDIQKGKAMFIKVGDSEPQIIDVPSGDDGLNRKVGGYFEVVPFTSQGNPFIAIVNEEGRIYGKEHNELASHYTNIALVGDVLIMNPSDLS
jgi:hypothetical protein|tara:strand:- start:112 stop:393 length:282 start_codon:yes stop_codon:yes gene_type:complete